MVTHETQEFLHRFNLLEDNSPTSYVLILPRVIDVVVVVLVIVLLSPLGGCPCPPFISMGKGLQGKSGSPHGGKVVPVCRTTLSHHRYRRR
jgi:hypothetical protein